VHGKTLESLAKFPEVSGNCWTYWPSTYCCVL